MMVSSDQRIRGLKTVLAAAVARRICADDRALYQLRATVRLKPAEAEWARTQQIDGFTLGRLVQIALALGCDVSIHAR